VCISQICKTEDYGKRYGTCYFFVSFGTLTGLPIAGAIQARQNGSYQGLILFSSAAYVIGIAFFIMVRIIGGGWSLKKIY
jgi:ABC-type multidrug transport system permease subunit